MFQNSFLVCLLLAPLAFTSCAKKKSDETNTEAWFATYSVKHEGNQVICEAKFQVGKGADTTLIELTGGDYVDCNGVSTVRADSLIGEVIYKTAIAPTTEVNITLHRKGEKDYTSTVGIPENIILNSPASGQVLNKQQLVTVSWATSSFSVDRLRINLTFSEASTNPNQSLTKYRTYVQDHESGTFGIPATETPGGVGAVGILADVPATLQLTRSRSGIMPQGLQGQIVATRSLSIGLVFR